MSDRKYRQHGYQDSGESKRQSGSSPRPPGPKPQDNTFGPRALNMPGARTVSRCAQCGTLQNDLIEASSRCAACGLALHSCRMCVSFDTSARFECTENIPARIFPKDAANNCRFFTIRQTVERETTSGRNRAVDARQAFENLFKK
jgi:hypothetical protein